MSSKVFVTITDKQLYNTRDDGTVIDDDGDIRVRLSRDVRSAFEVQKDEPTAKWPYHDELEVGLNIHIPDGHVGMLCCDELHTEVMCLTAGIWEDLTVVMKGPSEGMSKRGDIVGSIIVVPVNQNIEVSYE